MTRAQEIIDMLYEIFKGIQTEKNPCIVDHYTMIKGCDPDSVEFVIKEAINLLNKLDKERE